MNIQPDDRLRLLGAMLQMQNDMWLKMLQFVWILPVRGDVGITDSVGLETGHWRGHSLASVKF